MERKLASIQKITNLEKIENADNIEKATVMGWNVVVKKGEFSVGDVCIYFEIDAVLPSDKDWAAFMASKKFRVKTMKLRGCLSQGLALPASILPTDVERAVGLDVTDVLGVTKFEPALPLSGGLISGLFPHDVPKTDEIRLQSVPEVLDEIKSAPFFATVKLDGMSSTFIRRDDGLQVCSRNFMLAESNCEHWIVAKKYNLAERLPVDFAVQGEVMGPGIQKNRLCLKEHDLFVYNVYDIKKQKYLDYEEFVLFCFKHGLKTVPIAFEVDDEDLKNVTYTVDAFLQLASGLYEGTKNRREGLVFRPTKETYSKVLNGRLSFKVINNEFLLKDEE